MTTFAPEVAKLDVRPLSGTIGAEIRGVDLREPLDPGTVGELRELWLRYKVVFFPGQHLEPHHQVSFARAFGSPTKAHPVVPGPLHDHPEILVLDTDAMRRSKEYDSTHRRTRDAGWHTDVTFVATPPTGSILSGRVIPEAGGDTLWADTQAAYDDLDEPIRRLVDGLTARHDGARTFQGFLDAGFAIEWDGERYDSLEPREHPVVRTHPETGRRSLFVNPQFTDHIVGMSGRDSAALLDLLYAHITVPEHTVRHKWTAGDVAFWDNRSTMHYASRDYGDAHRVMHRVTLQGDRPV
ncbi:MAG: TauD/TfdA family dioxygenase [Acidimicrobiales bacterium]|nr:TauD/TfdA family dioxygenase [Acidimicrobiales bacterium]